MSVNYEHWQLAKKPDFMSVMDHSLTESEHSLRHGLVRDAHVGVF